jgi:hypothetical protein
MLSLAIADPDGSGSQWVQPLQLTLFGHPIGFRFTIAVDKHDPSANGRPTEPRRRCAAGFCFQCLFLNSRVNRDVQLGPRSYRAQAQVR